MRTKPPGAGFAGQAGKLMVRVRSLTVKGRFQRSVGKKLQRVISHKQNQTKDTGRQRRKPTTATATMLASVVFLSPISRFSQDISAYFPLNMSPARGPSDCGCARHQCGHCTLGYREGSEGEIKIKIFLKRIQGFPARNLKKPQMPVSVRSDHTWGWQAEGDPTATSLLFPQLIMAPENVRVGCKREIRTKHGLYRSGLWLDLGWRLRRCREASHTTPSSLNTLPPFCNLVFISHCFSEVRKSFLLFSPFQFFLTEPALPSKTEPTHSTQHSLQVTFPAFYCTLQCTRMELMVKI